LIKKLMVAELVDRKPRRRFQEETTASLEITVDKLAGLVVDSAWGERLRGITPNRGLNEAFMIALAILAERKGDWREGSRLRDTLRGFTNRMDWEQGTHFKEPTLLRPVIRDAR
jgi:hypothetical protein